MKNDNVHTKIKYSMRWQILGLTLIPMLLMAAIIMTIALKGMRNSLHSETSSGLEELANSLLAGDAESMKELSDLLEKRVCIFQL